jgi:hypothetical protein
MKKFSILALLITAIITGCQEFPPSSNDQETLATAVAATIAAGSAGVSSTETPIPAATEKTAPTSQAEAQSRQELSMQEYLLAYTNDGNVWTLSPDGSALQLTTSGDVVDLLLSDDRQLLVYTRQSAQSDLFEVRAAATDGSSDRQILSQEALDSLYPLDGALHFLTSQMEFIPGTHVLLFNTRATFDGPGLVKNDDLYRLDVDTGEFIQIITRERGGDFTISPDGKTLALSQPDSIALASIDGSDLRPGLVTFQPVITYSEYQYYPIPVWAPDSTKFGVFIPSSDPLAEEPGGTVWILPLEGAPRSFPPIKGDVFFPQSNGGSLLSPDLQTVAFLREDDQGQAELLFLSNLDGSNSRLYEQGDIHWIGWNEDGSLFAFRRSETNLTLGRPGSNPQSLADGRSLRWQTPEIYVVQAGQRGAWTLSLGHVDGTIKELVQPAGEVLVYELR